jgi:hypothetical protein
VTPGGIMADAMSREQFDAAFPANPANGAMRTSVSERVNMRGCGFFVNA